MKALTGIGIGIGLGPWRIAHAQGEPPYGALGVADINGVRLPARFTSRLLATTRELVSGTSYIWHLAPDGGATFAAEEGWVYVSNSEANGNTGA